MRMKSKVDLWISLTIWLIVAMIAIGVYFIPPAEQLLGFVFGLFWVVFLLWIYFGTFYELRDNYLLCRSGPFFEKIAYDKIKSLRLFNSYLSSMGLSSKQIEIRQHKKGYILGTTLISPEDREQFLEELRLRCKNLED